MLVVQVLTLCKNLMIVYIHHPDLSLLTQSVVANSVCIVSILNSFSRNDEG